MDQTIIDKLTRRLGSEEHRCLDDTEFQADSDIWIWIYRILLIPILGVTWICYLVFGRFLVSRIVPH